MTEKQRLKQLEKEEKERQKLAKEQARTEALLVYEKRFASRGMICGVDEAGRGPIAGPVVAGAVILPKDHPILYLNDSKKLSPKKREQLYESIMQEAVSVGIGMASPKRIDEINVLQATYEAMREAIGKLSKRPAVLLLDAVTIPGISGVQVPIIGGDGKSCSIAAASIVAKVTRDRLMLEYDRMFPQYGFAHHKGYGTKEHKEALLAYGPSPIHRKDFTESFLGKRK